MAVNVKIGESKTQSEKPFPKLMKHRDGTITRFEKSGSGVHIFAPKEVPVDYIISWNKIVGINMSEYVDYNEPITLQNA